jgi:hypothetical protein
LNVSRVSIVQGPEGAGCWSSMFGLLFAPLAPKKSPCAAGSVSLPSATVYPPGSCRTMLFQRHRFRLVPSNSSLGVCGVVSLNQSTLSSRLVVLADVA